MAIEDESVIERVFADSENGYITVLAIALRARQILEEYPKYEMRLQKEKAADIALKEFLTGVFDFRFEPKDSAPAKG